MFDKFHMIIHISLKKYRSDVNENLINGMHKLNGPNIDILFWKVYIGSNDMNANKYTF